MLRKKKFGSIILASLLIASLTGCGSGGGGVISSPTSGAQLLSISVTPADPSVAVNTAQQFTATGIYSDNSTRDLTDVVDWSSSDTSVAIVNTAAGSTGTSISAAIQSVISTPGHVYAAGEGTATIKATWGNKWGWGRLHVNRATLVSIAVTPANPSIARGTSQQFVATGTFSDNTTQDLTKTVIWSSSTGAANISNATGSAMITAASGGISGSTGLTINAATLVSITVTPSNPGIAPGTSQQFTATGTYSDNTTQNLTNTAAWSSSSNSVATINTSGAARGLATSVSPGTTTITAASGNISGSTTLTVNSASLVSIAVTPADPSIAKGTSQQFTAIGTYSDNSTQNVTKTAAWSSSNTSVAAISNAAGSIGLATASAGVGATTITAASGSVSGTTILTVNPATLVSLSITPASPSIGKGASQQFTVTGAYSDGSTQNLTNAMTWSSSSTSVATISNAAGSIGLATASAAGTTTISAASGSVSGTASLTVTASGSATLSWNVPTTNTDGTPFADLSYFKIYYGTQSGSYTTTVNLGTATNYVVNNLASGSTYYFAVTAVNSSGVESSYSNEANKTIP
jgi:hypothetical protein